MPIAHLAFHTKNIDKIASFYEAALAPLGYKERMRFHDGAVRGYGASKYDADFWISSKEDSNTPEEFKDQPTGTWGGPVHIAFHCTTRNQVRAFYDTAIAAGAKCNGPPGLRPQYFFTYYGAFVWDAEGRNIEAVCMRPGFWAEEWGVLGWTGILAVAAVGAGYLWQNYWAVIASAETMDSATNEGTSTPAQDPSSLLRHDLPARQALNSQELACLITGFLEAGYTSADETRRKDLLKLVLLNHAFYHAGTDALWKFMPSLSPFLRLLPQLYDDTSEQFESVTQAIKADPWSRFRFYSPKTKSIALIDDADAEKIMPLHWFNFLLALPSRPSSLFPELAELTVGSLGGVNSVIPFQVSQGLRAVSIAGFSKAGDYEKLGKGAVTSLVANFAFNALRLSKIAIESPLTDAMRSTLSQYSALETASLTIPLRFDKSQVAFLNLMQCRIKSLSFYSDGTDTAGDGRLFFVNGQHLTHYKENGKQSSVSTLSFTGDGCAMAHVMIFFSSPRLIRCVGTLKKVAVSDDGVYTIPQLLHRLSHSAPGLAELSFERNQPDVKTSPGYLAWFEQRRLHFLPDELYQDFTTRLGNLTTFILKYIPFLDPAFTALLVSRLSNMPQLQTLCLLPIPISSDERHNLILPTLECLQTFSSTNLALQHLTISLDMSTFPSNIPPISLPGHSLETLFIMPYHSNQKPQVSDLVALATYLDRLFPHLRDITSFFQEKEPCASVAEVSKFALGLWKDVTHLITPYQTLRKHVEHQLVQNLFGGEGEQ